MDVQAGIKSLTSNSKSNSFWTSSQKSVSCNYPRSCLKILCSKKDSNGDNKGDKFSTDWDKAWSNFKKQSKKSLFSGFSPNKFAPMTESWRLSFKSHRKTSIQILQMLSYSQHNKVFNLPSIAMEKAETEVKQKRVPPKRGEIKIRIISIIMEFVLRVASKACSGSQRKKKVALEEMQLQKTR
ncbi:hypothetical protein V6N13_027580 [Hibiscus sabdariffa]